MAILKCKMCGGDLLLTEGATTAECEYCGSLQTVPTADNEKKLTLFARANRLRAACEFDKAAGIYENIVADFPEEAEAYWGLVLCKYGIEYVDDPGTGKKIPTCHRSSFDSVMDDENFKQACENADMVAKKVYRDEAKQIEEIRKGILEVSSSEKPYDVFICYKETDAHGGRTVDSLVAQDIYDALTTKGYRTFFSRITLEDKLGQAYEPYIFAALNSAKVMLAVGTCYEHYDAVWVKNEWSRYLKIAAKDKNRYLIPCYKGIDAYDIPKEFAHLQGQDMGKVGAIADLIRGIEKLIPKAVPIAKETVIVQSNRSHGEALVKRGFLALEDEDWDKADRFFEEALNQNAESGGAYWGKLLASEQVCNPAALISKYDNQKAVAEIEPEVFSVITANHKLRIDNELETYSIPNYISTNAVASCFDSDKKWTYKSFIKGFNIHLNTIKKHFSENRLYQRAAQYADPALQDEMNRTLSAIYTAWQQRIQDAQSRAHTAKKAMLEKYEAHLEQGESKLKQLHAEACEARENDYAQACQLQESAIRAKDYEQVIGLFEKMGDFQDSTDRKEKCLPIYEELKAKEERRRARREAEIKRQKRAKRIRIAIICGTVTLLLIAGGLVHKKIVVPTKKYNTAIALMESAQYDNAIVAFESIDGYKDSIAQIEKCKTAILDNKYNNAIALVEANQYEDAIIAFETLGEYKDSKAQIEICKTAILDNKYNAAVALTEAGQPAAAAMSFFAIKEHQDAAARAATLWGKLGIRETISAGVRHTVGLNENGTVAAVGDSGYGMCNVQGWTDIVAVSAGSRHSVGLKSDGTVVATDFKGDKKYYDGQCDVAGWSDIVAVSAGGSHTVGLKADGTVVAVGANESGQCNVQEWNNIVAISAGSSYTVGLKADGTVIATKYTGADWLYNGQCDVQSWSDIIAISAGSGHTVGLKADGTVVAVGLSKDGRCAVKEWRDIVAISAGSRHTIGLKADGTVVATEYLCDINNLVSYTGQCDVDDWNSIVAISAGSDHTVGLKANGTVVATEFTGDNYRGQCNVHGWRGIKVLN